MALVDANSVPEIPADPAALLAAAAAMAPAAASVGERTTDAATRWSTLGDAFDTPDTSTAVGRAQPLVAIADDFESAASAVADAMSTLGETLAALAWTQAQLPAEVDAHVADVARYQASEAGQDEAARGILDGMGLSGWTQNESLRQHPVDPSAAEFGAQVFGTDGDNGMYPVTDHSALMPSEDGWGYFDRGTESLQNIARATTQTGEITRPQHTSDGNPLRSYWEEVIQNPGFSL